jgi:dCTP deaminase
VTVLQHEELRRLIGSDQPYDSRLIVTPLLDPGQIGPASIDLRLGTHFQLLRRTVQPGVDLGADELPALEDLQERVDIPFGKKLWLQPRQFALGSTLEYLGLPPDLTAYVLGRSSWARVGLIVAMAVMVHPGFKGSLTLELVNDGDSAIALYPGARIAQLAVHRLADRTQQVYGASEAKYQTPLGPQTPRLAKERAEVERLERVGMRLGHLPEADEGGRTKTG